MKPKRHLWEEGSTHRSIAGDEYDKVWDYVDQLEKALKFCQGDKEVMQNVIDVAQEPMQEKISDIHKTFHTFLFLIPDAHAVAFTMALTKLKALSGVSDETK